MTNILVLLLLVSAGQTADRPAETVSQAAARQGTGLWIGGTFFAPDEIASATAERGVYSDLPNVVITFTEAGRAKFDLVQQGRVGEPLEISVDGEILSTPILREPIGGNQVAISGAFTIEEAEAMARRIAPPRRP